MKKKEAKKERKLQREGSTTEDPDYQQDPQDGVTDGPAEEKDADN